MAVESDTDRATLLADFGATVTIGAATFTGIFRNAYIEIAGMAGVHPTVLARSSDISTNSIVIDSVLTIEGTNYKVKILQPDGTGFTLLVLEDQTA